MRHLVAQAGLENRIEVDSAGTGTWHVGYPPDERAAAAAGSRGVTLDGEARRVGPEDFRAFDLLVAMDAANRDDLLALAPDEAARARVVLLREFDPVAVAAGELEVPDPYYTGEDGFDAVADMIERACRGLLADVRARATA